MLQIYTCIQKERKKITCDLINCNRLMRSIQSLYDMYKKTLNDSIRDTSSHAVRYMFIHMYIYIYLYICMYIQHAEHSVISG